MKAKMVYGTTKKPSIKMVGQKTSYVNTKMAGGKKSGSKKMK